VGDRRGEHIAALSSLQGGRAGRDFFERTGMPGLSAAPKAFQNKSRGWPIPVFCAMTLPMASVETELLAALVKLDAAVKQLAGAKTKPDLRPLFTRIDELAYRLPRTADPELLHFLQKKSYEKARQKLQGLAVTRGSCGR
jgi:hypothetical protein